MSLIGLLLVIALASVSAQFGVNTQGQQQATGSFNGQQQATGSFNGQQQGTFGSQNQGSFGTQQQGSFGTQQQGSFQNQGQQFTTQSSQTGSDCNSCPQPMQGFIPQQIMGTWYTQAQIPSALPASIMGGSNATCANWVFSPMPDGTISLHANVRIGGARGPLISVTGLLSSVDRLTVGLLGLDLHLRSLIYNLNQYGLLGGVLRTLGLNTCSSCYGNFGGLLGGILGGNGILGGILGGNDGLLGGILGGNGGLLGGILGGGQGGNGQGLLGGLLKRDGAMADTCSHDFRIIQTDYSNYAIIWTRADIGADASVQANVNANVNGIVNANVATNVFLLTRSAVCSPIQINAYLRVLNTINIGASVNLGLISPVQQSGCWGY